MLGERRKTSQKRPHTASQAATKAIRESAGEDVLRRLLGRLEHIEQRLGRLDNRFERREEAPSKRLRMSEAHKAPKCVVNDVRKMFFTHPDVQGRCWRDISADTQQAMIARGLSKWREIDSNLQATEAANSLTAQLARSLRQRKYFQTHQARSRDIETAKATKKRFNARKQLLKELRLTDDPDAKAKLVEYFKEHPNHPAAFQSTATGADHKGSQALYESTSSDADEDPAAASDDDDDDDEDAQ